MDAKTVGEYVACAQEAAEFIVARLGPAKIALVLGSGLGPFVDYLSETRQLDFRDIPHMPVTAVEGHKGKLILGTVSGKRIYCLAGRVHPYEGYHMYQLTFMVRVMRRAGVELYVTTNSSGGCQPGMKQGCIMAIRDHLNWFHRNPLLEVAELAERHVDMRRVYSSRLLTAARRVAKREAVQLFEGTSVTTCGPTYESFAEVKAGAKLGASAFGMSLVPEAMVAYAEGMEVFGCSMITNIAAGIDDSSMQLTHEEVIGVSGAFAPQFTKFMLAFISAVATRPPRPMVLQDSENHLPNLNLPLPQPQAAPATREQLAEAAAWLRKQIPPTVGENSAPEVAIYASYGMENLVDYLRSQSVIGEVANVSLRDIPHFPAVSRSGRCGEIIFGASKLPGYLSPIIFLAKNALESYSCEEGVFVAQMLSFLGVQKLVHTFFACSANHLLRCDAVRIVGDATDLTTVAAVAASAAGAQYRSAPLFASSEADQEELRLALRFAGEHSSSPALYAHLLGPSFPTRAEVSAARLCNLDLVGITSLSLVFSARSLGIDCVGLAGVTYESGEDPLADASYVLWKKMRTVLLALLRGNFVPKHRSQVAVRAGIATPAAVRKPVDEVAAKPRVEEQWNRQVSFHLAQPVSQGSPEIVAKSANFLRSRGVQLEADLAIVLDSRIPAPAFFESASFRKPFVTVAFSEIPGFPERFSGALTFGETDSGKRLLILHGTLLFNEGRNNAEIGHGVRVLQRLLVRRLLFVNEVASYTRQAPMDSFVLLRDHFNLAGRNPLFGKNEAEFGIRFSDLGNLYTDTMRQSVRRCAQQLDLTMVEATCAFVIGPVFASLADANVITIGCDSQVACTGMIPEVIVARHANVPLAAIGIVKMFVVPGDVRGSNKFRNRNSRNLVGLITTMLHSL